MIKYFITAFLIYFSSFGWAQVTDRLSHSPVDSLNLSSTNNSDSVDILALVEVQVKEAMDRQLKGEIKSSFNFFYEEKELIKITPDKENRESSSFAGILKDVAKNKFLLLGAFSIFVFSITFIRRGMNHHGNLFKKELEEKIVDVEKENRLVQSNPESDTIRSKLINTSDNELVEKSVSAKAKELKIAKGEVILAARLKSYELSQLSLK